MRLLFDEQLSEELVPLLADLFPGSLHVRLLGGQGAGDQVVWQMAQDHACMLVTKDEDFHRLSVLRGAPPKVVWRMLDASSRCEAPWTSQSQAYTPIPNFWPGRPCSSEHVCPSAPCWRLPEAVT